MGGVKKKPLASMEKKQGSEGEGAADQTKGKKEKETKAAPQQVKRLPFLAPKMSEPEMVKALSGLKAITVYNASRVLGVNASIALGVLNTLEEKRVLMRAGGFSGHYVWTVAS
jgi:small subunit ribosomal protein S25e